MGHSGVSLVTVIIIVVIIVVVIIVIVIVVLCGDIKMGDQRRRTLKAISKWALGERPLELFTVNPPKSFAE